MEEPKFDEIGSIITRDNVYSCVMYRKECCSLVYKYGHVRNRRTRERFVTPEQIFNQQFLHLFDNVVYERQLIVGFTNLLYEAATSFQAYTNATNLNIDQNRNLTSESPIKNKLYCKFFSVVCNNWKIAHLHYVFILYIDMDLVRNMSLSIFHDRSGYDTNSRCNPTLIT